MLRQYVHMVLQPLNQAFCRIQVNNNFYFHFTNYTFFGFSLNDWT